MKKVYIFIIIVLFLGLCVVGALLGSAYSQIAEYENEVQTLQTKNDKLERKLWDFPMTEEEEAQYNQNKELILTVYTFGDTAINVSKMIHYYHRLGVIADGEIVSVEKRTWGGDSDEPGTTGASRGMYLVTADGSEYCVLLSNHHVRALIQGPTLDGEWIYMEIM